MNAELAYDAGAPPEYPTDGLPEVAILGRSNVGKSSVINTLVGRRGLARTSSAPGKTRRIHFYRVESSLYLVDLPGFGYASVGREERASWQPMVEAYLRGKRDALRGALLLIDVRRGPRDEERDLLEWLRAESIDTRVLFTKADKLKRTALEDAVGRHRRALSLEAGQVSATSSTRRTGFSTVAGWLRDWTSVEFRQPDGQPFR